METQVLLHILFLNVEQQWNENNGASDHRIWYLNGMLNITSIDVIQTLSSIQRIAYSIIHSTIYKLHIYYINACGAN